MKKKLLAAVMAVALAAMTGISTGVSAAPASQLWSVAVHIRYPNGFIYDHAFATGVPTAELTSILRDCARAHRGGSAVQYHCYAIPE
jgi:hypothetical protein